MAEDRYKSDCEFVWKCSKQMLDKLRNTEEQCTTTDGIIASECARMFLEIVQSITSRVLTELNAKKEDLNGK